MKQYNFLLLLFFLKATCAFSQTAEDHKKNGDKYFREEKFKDAIQEYDKAITKNANYAEAYFFRAKARISVNDVTGGVTDFDKVIQLEPTNEFAYINRGNTKVLLKDYVSALDDYDHAITLNPQSGSAFLTRQKCYT